jgi:hypothetical protein
MEQHGQHVSARADTQTSARPARLFTLSKWGSVTNRATSGRRAARSQEDEACRMITPERRSRAVVGALLGVAATVVLSIALTLPGSTGPRVLAFRGYRWAPGASWAPEGGAAGQWASMLAQRRERGMGIAMRWGRVPVERYAVMPGPMLAEQDSEPNMAMRWDPETGDLYATNPETGDVTIMHTALNETEHPNQPGPVKAINSGDPHTYFAGHKMSPRRVHAPYEGKGLDSITESPEEANFRRHLKMFNRYLGMDGEDQYDAAYRIWALHPSDRSGLEPEEDEEDEEAEDAAEAGNEDEDSNDEDAEDAGAAEEGRELGDGGNVDDEGNGGE